MRLGIDLDGVVADFILGWMTRYNLEFGAHLTEDLVDHWDAAADLTHFETLTDFWDWAGATGAGPTVFRHLSTYPGARETLCELATDHDIVILTMKPDWAASDTFAWIDDSPYAIPALVEHRPESIVCRYVRPWNKPVAGAHDIHEWSDFCAFVKKEVCEWSQQL
jgi:5'(3')-deoxyribonucleotidase